MTKEEMMIYGKKHLQQVLVGILCICIIVLSVIQVKQYKELVVSKKLNETSNDELVVSKNKEGLLVAKNSVLEAYKAKDFIKMKTQDATILKLQKLVQENRSKISKQGSVTILETEAKMVITSPTKVLIDTTKIVAGKPIYPTYTSVFNKDGWVYGNIIATKDSITVKQTFREEIDFVLGIEKTGFLGLGKGKSTVEATLHNPFNQVKVLKSYSTKNPPNKLWHIGVGVFYGVGSSFAPQVILGAGLMFTPINF